MDREYILDKVLGLVQCDQCAFGVCTSQWNTIARICLGNECHICYIRDECPRHWNCVLFKPGKDR
jgi:hypothetical protein